MRILSAIDTPLADEHVLATDPPLRPQAAVWRRRINAFTGRALSDRALTAEQEARAGIQRLRGQSVSAGVIAGLDVLAETGAVGRAPADAMIQVLPGSGLSRAGEDVIIASPRRLPLAELPVFARVDQLDAIAAGRPAGSTTDAPGDGDGALSPLLPRRIGPRLGALLGAAAAADLPRAAVLVAEPVTAVLNPTPRDDCPPDPRDDPYDDLQRIDGCRLVLYLWPSEMRARGGGPDYALPAPGAARRNRLAYGIFGVERGMGPDDAHPWEALGVPLALIGFRPDFALDFIDRAAVLRLGGRPRPRTPVVPASGNALLWQARVTQFIEQLAGQEDLSAAAIAAAFRQLPPVGFLPADVIDLALRRQALFPAGFTLTAAPVPLDQLDLAVAESAPLVPINLDVPDVVELLAPVPASVYEPGLLETATIDPAFARAQARYVADRTRWLVRRELVRRRRDVLRDAATGQRPAWPADDLPPAEVNPYPTTRPPVTATRFRRVAAGTAVRALRLVGAGSSLGIDKGDRIYVWVRIADATGLTGLGLRFGAAGGGGSFNAGVFWGDAAQLPLATGDAAVASRRQGSLPPAGAWTRLVASADARWTAAGGVLAGITVNGLELAQRGGTMEWGPVGRITADGVETVWVGDDAPPGALLQNDTQTTWPQVAAADDPPIVEPDLGTIEDAGRRSAVAVRDLRGRWTQGFLAPDLALLDEGGIDGMVDAVEARLKATNDAIDLAFVRARADIFRVRQFMLGADAASRLVTSPALADVALREDSARARSVDLAGFVKQAYQTDFTRDPNEPLETRRKPDRPRDVPAVDAGDRGVANLRMMAFALPFTPLTGAVALPVARRAEISAGISLAALNIARNDRIGIANVRAQLAIPGLVERTATVAERLTPPPSVEAHNAALAGKKVAMDAVTALARSETAGDRLRGIALADLPAPGYRVASDQPGEAPTPVSIGDWMTDRGLPANQQKLVDADTLESSAARHEADYFKAAVAAIDNTIALMRHVEGRVALYESLVTDAREVRETLLRQVAACDARLRTIDVEVEEARHDVGVAASLLAEEQARVTALNARRRAVIERHVTTIMFRRPPVAERHDELPVLPAFSALAPSPVAACLREHDAVPEEIRDYVGLFRDAPVAWFPALHAEVRRIDRLEAARRALVAVKARAAIRALPRVVRATGATRLLGAVARAATAQEAVFDRLRATSAAIDVGIVAALDLSAVHRTLADRASLGDLASGEHDRPELARRAATELEQLGRVAGCLHDAFGEVPPALRLGWAELLSGFDAPAPMHELAGLAGWGDLPLDLRRTQQGLVDFLFGRIDRGREEAEAAVNELVRICLLKAAHAPVDRVIPARLVAPAPARPGARLDLALDIRLARIGQVALVRGPDQAVLARAVVDDIADGVARARITQSFQPTASLAAGIRIELRDDGG
jgi:hypothetical protein